MSLPKGQTCITDLSSKISVMSKHPLHARHVLRPRWPTLRPLPICPTRPRYPTTPHPTPLTIAPLYPPPMLPCLQTTRPPSTTPRPRMMPLPPRTTPLQLVLNARLTVSRNGSHSASSAAVMPLILGRMMMMMTLGASTGLDSTRRARSTLTLIRASSRTMPT